MLLSYFETVRLFIGVLGVDGVRVRMKEFLSFQCIPDCAATLYVVHTLVELMVTGASSGDAGFVIEQRFSPERGVS